MGADRRRHGRGRRVRGVALLGCAGLLAGCASMPDSGDVTAVKASKPGDSQVRVYPVMPRENAEPGEIVDGFLEAMTGDDPGFATARKYLTKQAARTWRPEERTTVLTAAPDRKQPEPSSRLESPGLVYPLYGQQIATVDGRHAYRPVAPAEYSGSIHLVQVGSGAEGKAKEWRIDSLPPGLVLSESDFQRNYRSVNKYYFASGRNWVVADPVYIRQRQDPVTRMDPVAQTVKALLDGPTNWLKPVVDSRFPTGTTLKKDVKSLTPDDQNTLTVPLNDKADNVGREQCRKMAAQLLFTVGDLTPTRVEQVALQRSDGSPLCTLGENQKENFVADPNAGIPENPYFINAGGQLAELEVAAKDVGEPQPVLGPFGNGVVKLGSVAVARDERYAAAVTQDGQDLRVASIVSEAELPEPLVSSKGKRPAERLSAPSWDGRGDLWVADRDAAGPRLVLVPGGSGEALTVTTPWLVDGVRIEALRVSEDGVRIALLLGKGDKTTLHIGRVERHGSGTQRSAAVVDLESVAPRMESVTSVSWAGPSRLVVLGKLAGGVQQVRYIQTDGSTSAAGIPGLNQVQTVAAANDERVPLVASSPDDGIVRLQSGANWQPMVEKGKGTFPVYPG
ncbi:LpqB family beta-propeller domain-containing protein [Streptomyces sp. SP18CS02]|uniref:LpqB family beta-propeller domain-containing protein n=1 Tax=Streptomyces sp. SP18CS02 TaxID=3002531 RepID=UPI002E772E28|nr:LpqB family beta-propeller domain-containing protein [Streptomyces sp. SP18CS02]MEE1752188.1 LpqB family beta-propeller domain-containing protein [Streptomyces sp. SP18CS02]